MRKLLLGVNVKKASHWPYIIAITISPVMVPLVGFVTGPFGLLFWIAFVYEVRPEEVSNAQPWW